MDHYGLQVFKDAMVRLPFDEGQLLCHRVRDGVCLLNASGTVSLLSRSFSGQNFSYRKGRLLSPKS